MKTVVHDLTAASTEKRKHRAPNEAEGDSGSRGAKKPKTALEQSIHVDKLLESLTKRKTELIEQSRRTMESSWENLAKADCVKAFLFNSGHKDTEWTCLICANDFTPLLVADPDAVSTAFLYHCEQCGGTACFKCVLKQVTLNPHNDQSIGYTCAVCRFYNCNKINNGPSPQDYAVRLGTPTEQLAAMPYPSGYSTVRSDKAKGEKLPTSNAVSSGNADHARNEEDRQRTFTMIVEDREARVYDGPGSPRSPDSPYYTPTSPQYGGSY